MRHELGAMHSSYLELSSRKEIAPRRVTNMRNVIGILRMLRLIALLAIVAGLASAGLAQSSARGAISGTVKDPTNTA